MVKCVIIGVHVRVLTSIFLFDVNVQVMKGHVNEQNSLKTAAGTGSNEKVFVRYYDIFVVHVRNKFPREF